MVLIVDDDIYALASHINFLKYHGFEVLTSKKMSEALQEINIHGEDITLIVLDVMIPNEELFGMEESRGGRESGILFLDLIRKSVQS